MKARNGDRQREVLEAVRQYHQHRPSLATLAAWCGLSVSTTQSAIDALERDGLVIVRNRGRNRIDGSALEIVPTDRDASL